jgi:hypothetical protein
MMGYWTSVVLGLVLGLLVGLAFRVVAGTSDSHATLAVACFVAAWMILTRRSRWSR